ncbi:hypothetical protein [Cereibacter sphaeroides]|uniref:hypothetical protein n=1 Tax=Cereibacter sphaeroides TaxID=1063 RepID=UPI003FCD1964
MRCTVERHDPKKGWVGSGGMIDRFMDSPFGSGIATRCATRFLGNLPAETRLVVMFGLGARQGYVSAARKVIEAARPGPWRRINDVAYGDGRVTVVHVEHFAAQGALIPQWLGERDHPRAALGLQARDSVRAATGG